jgi:hypothetical protein
MAGPKVKSESSSRIFLEARWQQLVMLNYEVDPDVLNGLVPAGTELDLWQERCLVSVVGFRFLETRVLGLPIPWHRDFSEVNLRFYVRRSDGGVTKRGVVFVREIVPRRAIAWVANVLYDERYLAMPMRFRELAQEQGRRIEYAWRWRGRTHRLAVRVATADGEPELPASGSEEEFITEHYWGYVAQRDGSTLEYQVEHPRWRVWPAREGRLDADVEALYGQGFASYLAQPPTSAFVAEGSEVRVRRGVRLDA